MTQSVIRWYFRPPEAPQEFNYEFMSRTCFAAHASSRLFSGRNVDRTRESGGNRAYHMACSHTHMFATCLITCLSIKRYQFTGRDMPLQKSSGVAILVSLQECVFFFWPTTVHRETNSDKPQVKIRFAFHFVERKYCLPFCCHKQGWFQWLYALLLCLLFFFNPPTNA